ncbi:MAG TPA: carboxypeptidase-like regulatory domain-containing protein [Planctomycetota bacterium]
MVREVWRRPSIVVVSWCVIVVTIFVLSGDLRIEGKRMSPALVTPASGAAPASSSQPLVVRPERPSRAPLAGTATRIGRVFDAMGYLVVGAEIIAMDRGPEDRGPEDRGPGDRAAERTDADGEFRLALPEDRSTNVLVRASGQRPVWLRATASSPDALVVQLSPEAPWDVAPSPQPPTPSPLRGEGIVRVADGSPVAGAWVTAVGTGFWSRTDEIGRYVLPLPSATATLLVHQPDGGPELRGLCARLDVALPREQGVVPLPELVVEPAGAIRGTVRDSRGSPVAGVPIEVRGEGACRVIEAGAGGVFRLAGLLPGRYQVRALAFRGAIGDKQQIALGAGVADCDLQLLAADERRLRVLDERGSPVGGVYVASSVGGHRRGIAQADANGWAAVPVAVETQFDVRTAQDYTPVVVCRFESEPATLIVALP